MPDYTCTGQERQYYLTPSQTPGSTYTWWIDGTVQTRFTSNELIHAWNSPGTYMIEVQERSADGCPGNKQSGLVFVNPLPEIQVSVSDSLICDGKSVTITVRNPVSLTWGQWVYDLIVEPEAGITGNSANGTFTGPEELSETLFNNDTVIRKVVYRFIPRIVHPEGEQYCSGEETKISVRIHPRLKYAREVSDYNGYNISCAGAGNGYIRIIPDPHQAPYTFSWNGPAGYTSANESISGLTPGIYVLSLTGKEGCNITDTIKLNEPGKLGMNIIASESPDRLYNIACAGGRTGSVEVSALNNVGQVDYIWSDGYIGSERVNLSAGTYRMILSDSNNCRADSTFTLTEPEKIRITFEVTSPSCPEKPDGAVKPSVTGGSVTSMDYTYFWSDNSTEKNLVNVPEGSYILTVTDDNGCFETKEILIRSPNESCLIIPEAFSPNGDNINDVWRIGDIEYYPDCDITVFNRWGQMVWKSGRGYPNPWDGKSEGKKLPIDSYHYVISLKKGSKFIVGNVTIVK